MSAPCSDFVDTNMVFAVFNGNVHQLSVFGFFGGSEDEGGICGGILRLVFSNGSKVA